MQTKPGTMTTLSTVLNKLKAQGMDNEFVITKNGFTPGNGIYYRPEDLTIIKTYRFEGESDPADSSIVYIIQTRDGLTGYSIDAYGAYSTHDELNYDDFIKRIPVEEREEQAIFLTEEGE
jgi:hypothetical protein